MAGGERAHGTLSRYHLDKCRCPRCCAVEHQYAANRSRAIAYGTWRPYVDAAPVRAHVKALGEFGIGWMRLAAIAGVPRGGLSKLLYGDPRRGMAPSRRVRPETARALLAVEPDVRHLGGGVRIDGTGTRRRLRALCVAGWPRRQLAVRLGMDPANFASTIAGAAPVNVSTMRAVTALYDELWRADPREHGVRADWAARARSRAIADGWAPVGAWDDDTIDDPAARPDWTGRCGTPEGASAHVRLGIPPCPPCQEARAEARRRRRSSSPRHITSSGEGRVHGRNAA